jgi:proteasome lid subunit RPN8/RPN11
MLLNKDVEVCGYIRKTANDYEYVPCENVHDKPEDHFRFHKMDQVIIMTDPDVVAFCHSHPNGPDIPSLLDMETQVRVGKPAVIVCRNVLFGTIDLFSFGDHTLDYPLDGRDFRYGVQDCYEALRGWVWQNEHRKMASVPREVDWWNIGRGNPAKLSENPNMYETMFEDFGYREYQVELSKPHSVCHPRVGDLVLMKLGNAPVCNHAAVYVGNSLIYHHRVNHRSGKTPLGYCISQNYCVKWLRRADVL